MPVRVYRILPAYGGAPCGELRFTPEADGATSGSTEIVVAGPAGEAWMTLIREGVAGSDGDLERLEAALRFAARGLPVRVEGLPPEPPPPPVDVALLEWIRRTMSRLPLPDGLDRALLESPDPSRLLAGLFDAGESGPEPLRRWIDDLEREFRAPDAPPALSHFARAWLKFRIEKPKRVH